MGEGGQRQKATLVGAIRRCAVSQSREPVGEHSGVCWMGAGGRNVQACVWWAWATTSKLKVQPCERDWHV